MIALGVGLPVAGAVVLLLVQASFEQRRGLADTTVEENAYVLQSRITSCLRSMSSSGGLTGVGSSAVYNASHDLIVGYQTVYVFHANTTNGGYTTERISFNPSSGQVIYIPDMAPATPQQIVWMTTNSPTMRLRKLYFIAHFDGSQNSSLVDVHFEMDDNGYSQQGTTNNLADIDRSFSVQMRND
jgi:hypothetical protein